MTNALTKSYECKVCHKLVEYTHPVLVEYIDGERYDIPKLARYYKAKARYEHDATHKGSMDTIMTDKYLLM